VPGVNVCGSVSTALFSLAQRLGCSPIVLVGQDMAFTAGRTYAAGTGYETSSATVDHASGRVRLAWNDEIKRLHGTQHGARHESEPLMEVPAWGGNGSVFSGPSFMAINTWLEGVAVLLSEANSGVRLINATEGGASVKGFQDLTLRSVLDQLPERDCSVDTIVNAARSKARLRSMSELRAWATKQSNLSLETGRKARRARRMGCHALNAIKKEQAREINHAFSALDRAETELRHAVARVPLVDAWSHAAVDELLVSRPLLNGDSKSAAQQAIALGTDIASVIETSARELANNFQQLANILQHSSFTKGTSSCQ
jgi:hypothetical protein